MEFQLSHFILKDDTVEVLQSICQHIWKTQQWPQDWKRSVFIPIPKKGNAKGCSNYRTSAFISHTSKVMLKFSKPGFNSMWTVNFQMFKMDIEKAEESEIKLPTSVGLSKKQESSRKTSNANANAKSIQSCRTLCDPTDGSPPGSHPWDSPDKNTGVGCHFLLQCMKVKSESEVAQSCPTLRDPIDGSLPGSAVPGILQARILEWVAISFSNAWKRKVKVKSLSRVRLLATPWTAAYQAPLSMDFPGKSTGVGCHCLLWEKHLLLLYWLHQSLWLYCGKFFKRWG